MPTCILTTKDVTILEVMYERLPDANEEYGRLLRRKIDTARVVLRDDVPPNVATLNSRVSFSIENGVTDSRIISHEAMNSPVGSFLPITTLRGLSLLGLTVGQKLQLHTTEGPVRETELTAVLHQPEAAQRRKVPLAIAGGRRQPFLRLVVGGKVATQPELVELDDDPGPTAA